MTHAFFKGLLFLGAGSVIHAHGRRAGHAEDGRPRAPTSRSPSPPCSSARSPSPGVPPLSGFFSKDEIIWGAFAGPHPHPLLGVIGYVAAGLTAFYMGRLLFLTFFGASRADHHTAGAPARVAGGDDGPADRPRRAGGRGRLPPDPARRRAGDRRGARRARAARDATRVAIALAARRARARLALLRRASRPARAASRARSGGFYAPGARQVPHRRAVRPRHLPAGPRHGRRRGVGDRSAT